ncbi:UNVERIFIED_CONTAM: hypothetical protein GTU68_052027, partial [Idotea baltica]|nr:hypothetical protein [Idotea baltica]
MNQDYLELLKKLVECKSVAPEDNGALDIVSNYLKELGFEVQEMTFSDPGVGPIKNIYARYGTESPNLCFAGHTDVVPGGEESLWKKSPYEYLIKDGYIYGRGVTDMKGGVTCFLSATKSFLENNSNFKGSISFLITGHEENSPINGTRKVVEELIKNNEKIDVCLLGEPSNTGEIGSEVKIGRRGNITYNLEIRGKSGHTAYPHLAHNPIDDLINILHELKSNKLDQGSDNFPPSNIEIPTIDVGNDFGNRIPDKVNTTINIRQNNLHTVKSIEEYLRKTIEKYSDD